MCGRYALYNTGELPVLLEISEIRIPPRFNIAPTQDVPVVRLNADRVRRLEMMRWGLVPSWAKDPSMGQRMINARCETAATKPSFRSAFRRRRCLIPSDGFYEWKKTGAGKQPLFYRMKDKKPFAFAGLWESWRRGDAPELNSCTILTTTANTLVAAAHDRMPVILARDDYRRWLDPDTPGQALDELFVPFPPDLMTAFPVSRLVNSPANDTPTCIRPLESPDSRS